MGARSATILALAALAAASRSLGAQRVRGALTDSATREPVAGAVVTVLDSAGNYLARSIADASGKYAVLRVAGSRQIHIVRIGYRPRDAAIGPDSVVDLRMQPVPAFLNTVSASGKRVCPGESGNAEALGLWEQARAGLLASVVAREAHPPRVRLRTYSRTMEPVRRRVVDDTVDVKDVLVERSFVAGRPAWAFAESGYMREGPGGERDYFAPDENVLLDATFAATHCLRVVQGEGPRAAQIGIGFDPVGDPARDTLVDITGILWLARSGLALEAMDFHYTNLEREAKDAGGELSFVVLPNGAPMIERWIIRSPVLAFDEDYSVNGVRKTAPPRRMRANIRILGFRETGGQVGFARWPDGTEWHADIPRLRGVVTDLQGTPIAGARIWLRESSDTATSAADGTYRLPYVFPGIYVVMASDSVLAAEGIGRAIPTRVSMFRPGDIVENIELNPRSVVLPLVCPAKSYKPGTGVLLAHIVDAAGAPVAGARVEVEARQLIVAGDTASRTLVRTGQAGADGRFVICGASMQSPLVVRAFKDLSSGAVVVDQWSDEIATVKLVVRPASPPRF